VVSIGTVLLPTGSGKEKDFLCGRPADPDLAKIVIVQIWSIFLFPVKRRAKLIALPIQTLERFGP